MPLTSSQIEEAIVFDSNFTLPNVLNLHLQNNISEQVVISALNKLLSVSKTLSQGLEYLNLILNNCSVEVVSQNALNWINHCLVKNPSDNLKEAKLISIGNIVENAHNDHEFTKKFVSDYLNKVLEMCLSAQNNSNETEAALGTLTICMRYYASWFTSHKTKIETSLLQYLESSRDSTVEKAAGAYHFLQQVGGAGVDGSNHKISFSSNFQKLCASVQKLFDKFLENETEFDEFNIMDLKGFEFNDSVHDSQKLQHVVARRIHNCLQFLMTMMIKGFPVAKEIKPLEVLDIIRRGTSIHHCVSTENVNSVSDYQFSVLLNNIQVQLLQLLRVTIIWLQANSLPFSFIISKILVDCLKKIGNCDCFQTDWLYKETIYKVLHQWIRISKCSLHPHFQIQLISCILMNITPVKSNISITDNATPGKKKSKNAQLKEVTEKIISGRQENVALYKTEAQKFGDAKVCSAALDALRYLWTSSYVKIDKALLKNVHSSVLGILQDINTSNIPHPYTNPGCQAKLYEALVSFYEQDTLETLPPLQLTLDLLNKGVNSYNRHISDICERGLNKLEKLCQPVCPSLYSPDMFSIRHTNAQKEQIFNEQVVEMLAQPVTTEPGKTPNITDDGVARLETPMEGCDPLETEEGELSHSESVSVKILDVQIVQPSNLVSNGTETEKADHREGETAELENQSEDNESINVESKVSSPESTINNEINILKDEVLNYSTIDLDNTISHLEVTLNEASIEMIDSENENAPIIKGSDEGDVEEIEDQNEGGPPSKKCRREEIDSEEIDVGQNIQDVETTGSEEVDKSEEFQDDSFVDEIKDY